MGIQPTMSITYTSCCGSIISAYTSGLRLQSHKHVQLYYFVDNCKTCTKVKLHKALEPSCHSQRRGYDNVLTRLSLRLHLLCFSRIVCSLPMTSNNLPIATMSLMHNHQACCGHRVGATDDGTLLYFFCIDVVDTPLPCPPEEASLL